VSTDDGRRWAGRRNPLRRSSDRIEAFVTFVLLAMMLMIAPWVAWSIAGQTYRGDVRATEWDRAHRFPATAELLRDAPGPEQQTGDAIPAQPARGTLARWTGPDMSVHTGLVLADFGSRQGSTVPIWIDDHGAPTGSPKQRSPKMDAAMASLLTLAVLGALLFGAHRLVVWRLDRRRMRAWQQEWLEVEPRWTHR
jgi:hypothetical protein